MNKRRVRKKRREKRAKDIFFVHLFKNPHNLQQNKATAMQAKFK
jgi:hypothetical protein